MMKLLLSGIQGANLVIFFNPTNTHAKNFVNKMLTPLFGGFVGKTIGEIDFLAGVGKGVNNQKYSGQNKGNAEPLPHIERHCRFKSDLIVFDKLD